MKIRTEDINFENEDNLKEKSGFSLEEKKQIINMVVDFGIPVGKDNLNYDWLAFKERVFSDRIIKSEGAEKEYASKIEKFVMQLQIMGHAMLKEGEVELKK